MLDLRRLPGRHRTVAAGLLALFLPFQGEAGMPGVRAAQIQDDLPLVVVNSSPPAGLPADTLPEDLVEIRKRMVTKQFVGVPDLRRLADHGDGYAAWLLAERLYDRERWDLTSDIAHYYAVAADTGRVGGLHHLMEMIARPEFTDVPAARLNWFEQVLTRHAVDGTPSVAEFLIDAYGNGHPFGVKPGAAIALLARSRGEESAGIAMSLATDLLRRQGVNDGNVDEIRQLLDIAAASDALQMQILANNLRAVIDERMAEDTLEDTSDIALQTGDRTDAATN